MVDFGGIPLHGGSVPIRLHSDAVRPLIPVAEPVLNSQGLSGRMPSGQQNSPGHGGGKDAPADRPRAPQISDPRLTGPSPAFQANVLDMEKDLQVSIARIEAARGNTEAQKAISISGAASAPESPDRGATTPGAPGKEAGETEIPEHSADRRRDPPREALVTDRADPGLRAAPPDPAPDPAAARPVPGESA